MYTARQFGIDRKEGQLKTFMSNDWMHGVLVNYNVDTKVRTIASLILGAEILSTSVALVNYTAKDNKTMTVFSIYVLLYSMICLSNATMN